MSPDAPLALTITFKLANIHLRYSLWSLTIANILYSDTLLILILSHYLNNGHRILIFTVVIPINSLETYVLLFFNILYIFTKFANNNERLLIDRKFSQINRQRKS